MKWTDFSMSGTGVSRNRKSGFSFREREYFSFLSALSAVVLIFLTAFRDGLTFDAQGNGLPFHLQVLIFFGLAITTGLWEVRILRYGEIMMGIPVFYSTTLLFGPFITAILIVTSGLLKAFYCSRIRKEPFFATVRETIYLLLAFTAGGILYRTHVGDPQFFSGFATLHKLAWLILSSLIVFLILHMLTGAERIFTMRLNIRYIWRVNLRSLKVHMAMLVPLGLLAVTIFQIEPVGLVLLVPVYSMYRYIRNYAEILGEARSTIEDLALAFESRDPFSKSHSINVAQTAGEIAREMCLEDDEIEKIVSAGKLHDLGKIGIADEILEKGKFETLSFEEYEEIRKHPEMGHRVTQQLSWYQYEAKCIYHHHEWYDGSGYPKGLRGEEIPLGARILAVAETFDSMASPRSYRDPVPLEIIIDEMRRKSGTQFDPMVVEAFIRIVEDIEHRIPAT